MLRGISEPQLPRARGGLVFKADIFWYHSTLGLRVIKKKRKSSPHASQTCGAPAPPRHHPPAALPPPLPVRLRHIRVDVRLPGKGKSNSHGARPVHLIITMIKWIRTSQLSIKNSLSRLRHAEIGMLLPNNQRQHRTWHVQKDVLPCCGPHALRSPTPCAAHRGGGVTVHGAEAQMVWQQEHVVCHRAHIEWRGG